MTDKVVALRGNPDVPENSGPAPESRPGRDHSQFVRVLRKLVQDAKIDLDSSVLIIGGTQVDANMMLSCGFHRITLSNIGSAADRQEKLNALPTVAVDAEDIQLADDSFDLVFIHEVIHHCRSPHRALCESLRVAKHHVLLMEPNDSAFMRLLCRLRFSYPFELPAVVDNDYTHGGVRDTQIPNYIFRWNAREVNKLASSYLAECEFHVLADPYWEFNIDERELAYRKLSKIGMITGVIGAKNFLRLLHLIQFIANHLPVLRGQGNKFICCIQKTTQLRPWLIRESDGQIAFKRSFQAKQP
jgi:SAM-dependent methyltransferase